MMDGMTTLTSLAFAKGHGTGNDFVLVPDPDGRLDLDATTVAAVCDRRFGIGGDGLLRVVRTSAVAAVADHADEAEWFMDYRNADGSLSEMCGNGVRVFARYLVDSGLAEGPEVAILTRAGRVVAEVGEREIAVDMPLPVVTGESVAHLSGVDYKGTVVSVGNPHLVCWVDDPSALELAGSPELDPTVFPAGANIEFIARTGDGQVRMRVIERGVGETLSCGSGACAAGAVALRDAGLSDGTVTVDVPGGRLAYSRTGERCVLAGPAVIVATGTFS